MAETTISNQFPLGLWETLSTKGSRSANRPILAFASSFVPYFALVTQQGSMIRRTLFSKRGKKEEVIDVYDGKEKCSLPQKIVGHTLPLIAKDLSCPNLIDLEGYYGIAMTHIFFDQMLPLFPDSGRLSRWLKNDWFAKKEVKGHKELLEEFDYQKATLETLGMELLKSGKKETESSFATSYDALRATREYLAFRTEGRVCDDQLVWRSISTISLTQSIDLVDRLTQSVVQEAQIRNLKRAFNAGEKSYASMLASHIHSMVLRSSPIATSSKPRYEFNTLAFDLSKTKYDSFVSWEIKRSSSLMLLA